MRRSNVSRAILTQPLGNTDNSYILSCKRSDPDRFEAIVLVDPGAPDAVAALANLAREGASGVRLRPSARSAAGDGLDIWRAAGAYGLAVSSPGTSADFASAPFAELVSKVPDVRIVVEHLGGGNTPGPSENDLDVRASVFSLARFPNVFMKVPGVGEIARRAADRTAPFPFELPKRDPFLEALANFGSDRLMWGSDFPVVSSREGYGNALRFCLERFAACSTDDRALIFGGVADRVFAAR